MDESIFLRLFPKRPRPNRIRPAQVVVEECESRIVPTNYTWTDAGGDGKWATTTNWSPTGLPGSADSVTFPATLTSPQTVTLPASTNTTIRSITFSQTSGA